MRSLYLLLLLGLTAACQPSAQQGKELMELYTSNREARTAKLTQCKEDGGFVREEFACLIAREAAKNDSIGSFRELPPLELKVPTRQPREQTSQDESER